MPEVEFHTHIPDGLLYACRLLRKATASAARVLVTADAPTLAQLDQQLWAFSSTEFVPHCFDYAPAQVLGESPIVLTQRVPENAAQAILLNLGSEVPAGFEQFARILEIVSENDDDKRQARSRWKQYAAAGCQLSSHNTQAKATP